MKKHIFIILMLVLICAFVACADLSDTPDFPRTPDTADTPSAPDAASTPEVSDQSNDTKKEASANATDEGTAPTPDTIELMVELADEDAALVIEAVERYVALDVSDEKNAAVYPKEFAEAGEHIGTAVPLTINISTKNAEAGCYKIELADNEALTNAKVIYVSGKAASCSFSHLHTNTEYFYRVTVYMENGIFERTGHFITADTPRILSISGIHNVRDIGNWGTDSGKRIKQGVLIRGTTMDGAVEPTYCLTNEGLADMLINFGIKTDVDLRPKTEFTKDALGIHVGHKYYDMVLYEAVFTDYGKKKVKAVFLDLANPDIYPAYIHCTYGTDRTGTVCYILEAVLGVSRDDCRTDYALSNQPANKLAALEEGLAKYEGETLKEQTENFLIDCGITKEEIESIRNIFLGE